MNGVGVRGRELDGGLGQGHASILAGSCCWSCPVGNVPCAGGLWCQANGGWIICCMLYEEKRSDKVKLAFASN